ncbi:MAG: cellulase family glycosylhydrolase [Planctomycetota bacterium]|nr:cellulase family glycosylhydrolase [Planctomycetota bacterium]
MQLDKGGKAFVLSGSGQRFVPWGLNYGCTTKLLEEYWQSDWARVVADFQAMKTLGANVVRIHLQVGHFMEGPEKPNDASLRQLERLVKLAEEMGLYLDLTGLACYRTEANPKWYDALAEKERWAVQARFWEALAEHCAASPAVFCYDLMNEPVVPSGQRKPGEWLSGKPLGGFDFVQWISLDQADRPCDQIARQWIKTLTQAIRKHDKRHRTTLGLLPSTRAWGHFSGFIPEKVAPELDFISVHIYPKKGKVDVAIKMLKGFLVGKPLVIEETFPLSCSASELKAFLLESRTLACGWMGHYSGESPEELEKLRQSGKLTIPQALWLDWLNLFRDMKAKMKVEP